ELEPNKKVEDVEIKVVNNENSDIKIEVTNTSNNNEDFSEKTIVVPSIKVEESKKVENNKETSNKIYDVDNMSENVKALVDNYVQKAEKSEKSVKVEKVEKIENTEVSNAKKARRKINLEEELFKIDSNITYDYSKI